jgi:erythromycin esterase-like protein
MAVSVTTGASPTLALAVEGFIISVTTMALGRARLQVPDLHGWQEATNQRGNLRRCSLRSTDRVRQVGTANMPQQVVASTLPQATDLARLHHDSASTTVLPQQRFDDVRLELGGLARCRVTVTVRSIRLDDTGPAPSRERRR